ncbi:hypothetical protein XBLMG947_0975 [Xanthomonas bromi]|uniref:Uncharacterized protein n=1 Tax=Xanthomonas bromi TaxID=56449 RepID=A0A1C3NIL2_9XANT|nr:hypothetical protein XBLMG947_0975 [Xanthomonas bromi]
MRLRWLQWVHSRTRASYLASTPQIHSTLPAAVYSAAVQGGADCPWCWLLPDPLPDQAFLHGCKASLCVTNLDCGHEFSYPEFWSICPRATSSTRSIDDVCDARCELANGPQHIAWIERLGCSTPARRRAPQPSSAVSGWLGAIRCFFTRILPNLARPDHRRRKGLSVQSCAFVPIYKACQSRRLPSPPPPSS